MRPAEVVERVDTRPNQDRLEVEVEPHSVPGGDRVAALIPRRFEGPTLNGIQGEFIQAGYPFDDLCAPHQSIRPHEDVDPDESLEHRIERERRVFRHEVR